MFKLLKLLKCENVINKNKIILNINNDKNKIIIIN